MFDPSRIRISLARLGGRLSPLILIALILWAGSPAEAQEAPEAPEALNCLP